MYNIDKTIKELNTALVLVMGMSSLCTIMRNLPQRFYSVALIVNI